MARSLEMAQNPYNQDLDRNPANYQPLTPLGFLQRAAETFPTHTAIIHGDSIISYEAFYARARQLGSVLAQDYNLSRGHTVSVMLANTPAMLEAHYGIPMCGAVIHCINTRLDAAIIAYQIDHAESQLVIVDAEFMPLMQDALALATRDPILVCYDDAVYEGPRVPNEALSKQALDYEALIACGDPHFAWVVPEDEWDAISIGYTSGTTGKPKGVVSHHRGAYLLAQGHALIGNMDKHAVYLWTLPMFHCNGWCFPWTLSAIIGTHICLRQVRAAPIWQALANHKVTHLCGAPIVMSLMIDAPESEKRQLPKPVQFFTAAAPPPETLLQDMGRAGFLVTHLYGLTETYGPAVVNEWHEEWYALSPSEQATLKARQGVRYLPLEDLQVLHPDTMTPVPRDGTTIGEVMFRGNVVMKGYFKNKEATREAFEGGWFHSGDLAVIYPDSYIQLKDRSKDIIISGGENISSIEIEEALYKHDRVAVVAVVAMPHPKWGETPCAFVELTSGPEISEPDISEAELHSWCRDHLAGFKMPARICFQEIPRTSTGKIQKFALRDLARALADMPDES